MNPVGKSESMGLPWKGGFSQSLLLLSVEKWTSLALLNQGWERGSVFSSAKFELVTCPWTRRGGYLFIPTLNHSEEQSRGFSKVSWCSWQFHQGPHLRCWCLPWAQLAASSLVPFRNIMRSKRIKSSFRIYRSAFEGSCVQFIFIKRDVKFRVVKFQL